jgi:hypothetical protein
VDSFLLAFPRKHCINSSQVLLGSSSKDGCAGHVARTGRYEKYNILVGNHEGKEHLGNVGICGRINTITDLEEMRLEGVGFSHIVRWTSGRLF